MGLFSPQDESVVAPLPLFDVRKWSCGSLPSCDGESSMFSGPTRKFPSSSKPPVPPIWDSPCSLEYGQGKSFGLTFISVGLVFNLAGWITSVDKGASGSRLSNSACLRRSRCRSALLLLAAAF